MNWAVTQNPNGDIVVSIAGRTGGTTWGRGGVFKTKLSAIVHFQTLNNLTGEYDDVLKKLEELPWPKE